MKSENDIEKESQSNAVQGHAQEYRDLQGMPGAYSGTQWMCTAANRGSLGVQRLCSGADIVCTGVTGEGRGFSYEQVFFSQ